MCGLRWTRCLLAVFMAAMFVTALDYDYEDDDTAVTRTTTASTTVTTGAVETTTEDDLQPRRRGYRGRAKYRMRKAKFEEQVRAMKEKMRIQFNGAAGHNISPKAAAKLFAMVNRRAHT